MMTLPSTDLVISIARAAGEKILTYYHATYSIHDKEDNSPVTDADLASNTIITKLLSEISPFPVLSEETKDDRSRLNSESVWIVDPLDGTKDFIRKTDEFSVMIALVTKHKPVLGVVYNPALDELYFARTGDGAFFQQGSQPPQRMHVSSEDNLQRMRLVLSRSHIRDDEKQIAQSLGIEQIYECGSVGVKMGRIARDQYDFYFNTSSCCGEWDTCAPEIILIEAGGVVTDINGTPLAYNQKDVTRHHGVVASNGPAHDTIIRKIQAYPRV